MLHRAQWLLFSAFLFVIVTPGALRAWDGDKVHFGRSIDVDDSESAGNLVCMGCSVRVDGNSEDIVTVGGSIVVEGAVKGDVVAVGGSILLGENASVSGDLVTVGGHLSRHPNAVVKGEITEQSGALLVLGIFLVPLVPLVLLIALIVWLVGRDRRPAPIRA